MALTYGMLDLIEKENAGFHLSLSLSLATSVHRLYCPRTRPKGQWSVAKGYSEGATGRPPAWAVALWGWALFLAGPALFGSNAHLFLPSTTWRIIAAFSPPRTLAERDLAGSLEWEA